VTQVSDNFQRPNGSLGSNWTVFPLSVEGTYPNTTGNTVLLNHAFAPDSASAFDSLSVWTHGEVFGNDQVASYQIASLAGAMSTISISAASQSGSTTTYTYTLTSGQALLNPGLIQISGMADGGNNGLFIINGLGGGTFSVNNAAGVTRGGQSGIGTSCADSLAGASLRATSDGKNAYWFFAGPNSFSGNKIYTLEVWKMVNGAGTLLSGIGGIVSTPDIVGDIYTFAAVGPYLRVAKNGTQISTVSVKDTALTSGLPGLWTWSVAGSHEYDWANWPNATMAGAPGNNGSSSTNWIASDLATTKFPIVSDTFTEGPQLTQIASDNFTRANGPIGANWTVVNGGFNISGNTAVGTGGSFNGAAWTGSAINADHYSTITIGTGTGFWAPATRVQSGADTYYAAYVSGTSPNITGAIFKRVAGTNTSLGGSVTGIATGDTVTLASSGPILQLYHNGVLTSTIADTSISGGKPGMSAFSTTNAITNWVGGNYSDGVSANFSLISATQGYVSDTTFGGYGLAVDASSVALIYENAYAWPNDQYTEVITSSASAFNAAGQESGPAVRIQVGADSCYAMAPNSTNMDLYKMVAGTNTILDSQPYTYAQGDLWHIEAQGNIIVGKVNGATIVTGIDSTFSTGKPGYITRTAASTSAGAFKNWVGGQFTNPASGAGAFTGLLVSPLLQLQKFHGI
jgi:hypothetical protein